MAGQEGLLNALRLIQSIQNDFGVGQGASAAQNRNAVSARSGGNVQVSKDVNLSDNYKNSVNNAVKFYQKEFKMTPHVNLYNDPDALGDASLGATDVLQNKGGQYNVDVRYADKSGEKENAAIMQDAERRKWTPKNAVGLEHVPVHEFGHALMNTLFDTKVAQGEGSSKKDLSKAYEQSEYNADKLYKDALKDIGVNLKDAERYPLKNKTDSSMLKKTISDAHKKVKEISGYASAGGKNIVALDSDEKVSPFYSSDNPHEVIAESLADYYYNRDKAADLSKAIVKRLKKDSSTYGLRQAGGVGTGSDANKFVKNLRRYKAIQ